MKRSTLLKVVSVLMIIFSVIALIMVVMSTMALAAFGDLVTMLIYMGIDPTIFYVSLALSFASCGLEFIAGICGFAAKRVSSLVKIGIVIIIVAIASIVLSVLLNSFNAVSLIGLALPVLYLIGSKISSDN